MSRKLFPALLVVVVLTLFTGQAYADHVAYGKVVTCPAGDPIEDIGVWIYWEDILMAIVQTNAQGEWSYDTSYLIACELCDYWELTATIHIGDPDAPCDSGCCPAITLTLPCEGNLAFPDLEFKCGRKIPCPQQN